MWNRIGAFLMVILGVVLVAVGVASIFGGFSVDPQLKPQTISVWMPKNPDVYPRAAVQPGTFLFKRSLEELQALDTPEQRVTVAYSMGGGVGELREKKMEYWRPRGDTTFDYTKVGMPSQGSLPFPEKFAVEWTVQFNRESASFVYTPEKTLIGFWIIAGLGLLFGGIFVGVGVGMARSRLLL